MAAFFSLPFFAPFPYAARPASCPSFLSPSPSPAPAREIHAAAAVPGGSSQPSFASAFPTGGTFRRHFSGAYPLRALPLALFSSPLEALAFAPASAVGASLTLLLAGLVSSLGLVGLLSLVARLQPEGASFTPAFERLTSYECGFAPFGKLDQPQLFLFYKLAVFFVIFEAELVFLYPWALALVETSATGLFFLAATPFLLVLYLGFFYEIDREALDF